MIHVLLSPFTFHVSSCMFYVTCALFLFMCRVRFVNIIKMPSIKIDFFFFNINRYTLNTINTNCKLQIVIGLSDQERQ